MLARVLGPYARWIAVGCLAATVFVLGYAGFRQYYLAANRVRCPADIAYVTVQLFIMQSGDLEGPINWKLQFARFAAPVGFSR